MQLVAYGAQDIYLTGNPQITFFKVVYRRHTNFSMEAIEQTFNGTTGLGESKITSTISRNGDLVYKLWLDVELKSNNIYDATTAKDTRINWTNNTGHAFLKECEIEIGGQRIDRHYSQWLDIWNEVSDHDEQEWLGLNKHGTQTYLSDSKQQINNLQLYIPLKFWFCRNPGLALPLIALQYHEVKIKMTTRSIDSLVNMTKIYAGVDPNNVGGRQAADTIPDVKLWADYIYLDTDERRRFAQVSHEYLIEQVQRNVATKNLVGQGNVKLNFNHPVKELLWVIQDDRLVKENITSGFGVTGHATANDIDPTFNGYDTGNGAGVVGAENDYFKYITSGTANIEALYGVDSHENFDTMKLRLNGHDRFKAKKASYFRTCQMIQADHKVPKKHIYCYSFSLKPEDHQPSGTCNFSRIDNAEMNFSSFGGANPSTISVYAVNYNVLRIMSGMGGLAYSN